MDLKNTDIHQRLANSNNHRVSSELLMILLFFSARFSGGAGEVERRRSIVYFSELNGADFQCHGDANRCLTSCTIKCSNQIGFILIP